MASFNMLQLSTLFVFDLREVSLKTNCFIPNQAVSIYFQLPLPDLENRCAFSTCYVST